MTDDTFPEVYRAQSLSKGTVLTVTNDKTDVYFRLIADGFGSGVVAPGQSVSFNLDKEGTFAIYDDLDRQADGTPNLTGTITVTE